MLRYYLDCKVVERQEAAHLLGLLFHAAHGFIARNGLNSLALDWPEAKFGPDIEAEDEEERQSGERERRRVRHPHPGGKLRLFAPDEALLRAFAQWEGVARLTQARAVLLTGVRPVPEEPQGWRVWRRARASERQTGAYILRTEERFLRRMAGRGIDPALAERYAEDRRRALLARAPEARESLFLRVRSKSTGQRLSFFIERQEASAPQEGAFDAYGLSGFATTPEFG
jgi:CRISPR-associated endoribonuclease Cas6/Csy4 subtype I-F